MSGAVNPVSHKTKKPSEKGRQGEVSLNDEFVSQNIGLVHACCNRFKNRGVEYDELFSAGCLGLCKAVKGFDQSRGIKFSTYAVPVILGEIKLLFRDGGSIKVGRALKERAMHLLRIKQQMLLEIGREPTISELCEKAGLSYDQTAEALSAAAPVLSLTVGENGESTEMEVKEESCEENVIGKTALFQALSHLSEGERKIIELRYFCGDTQSQAAKKLGTNQVQISRKEKAILLKLRGQLL